MIKTDFSAGHAREGLSSATYSGTFAVSGQSGWNHDQDRF